MQVGEDAGSRGRALVALVREWPRFEHHRELAFRAITEAATVALDVPRASIWLLSADRDAIVCADAYVAATKTHTRGAVLRESDHPAYFEALEREDALAASDVRKDPRTRELRSAEPHPEGVEALLDAPIRVGGRLEGVVCHEHLGAERVFTDLECAHAALLSSLASLVLELGERRKHELAASEAFEVERAVLEATNEGIIATDQHGRVLACNGRFCELWGVDDAWAKTADRDTRVRTLAERTKDPAAFVGGVDALVGTDRDDVLTEITLADGRILERVSRPLALPGRIGRVFNYRDVTAERAALAKIVESEARMRELATHDALTGLLNRRALLPALDEALAHLSRPTSERRRGVAAVLMMDLDHFKRVNDRHGHAAGDAVLQHFGHVLGDRLRRGDLVGRWGGEEFVALADVPDPGAARGVADEIRSLASRGDEGLPHYTVSIGLALGPADGVTATELLRVADQRLYDAKHAGRDRVVG
jgi:diguanylate cyclase (GGDEF)-like protein